MELDGYNESRHLAFEHQGMQHTKFIKHFHKTKKSFEDLQHRDKTKIELCAERKIHLVIVDQLFSIKTMSAKINYIRTALIECGYNGEIFNIVESDIKLHKVYEIDYRNLVEFLDLHLIRLVTPFWLGRTEQYEMECMDCGCVWSSLFGKIIRNKLSCPDCKC